MKQKTKKMKNRTIKTISGIYIDVFDPDPDLIFIEDIAHGLSNNCRFGGHVQEFYSVAEHCIWMAERALPEDKLEALLHDASEAYLLDLPKPIKNSMLEYQEVEYHLMVAISMKFGFAFPLNERVKELDALSFEYEKANKRDANNFESMSPKQAKKRFLELYEEITQKKSNLITKNI